MDNTLFFFFFSLSLIRFSVGFLFLSTKFCTKLLCYSFSLANLPSFWHRYTACIRIRCVLCCAQQVIPSNGGGGHGDVEEMKVLLMVFLIMPSSPHYSHTSRNICFVHCIGPLPYLPIIIYRNHTNTYPYLWWRPAARAHTLHIHTIYISFNFHPYYKLWIVIFDVQKESW